MSTTTVKRPRPRISTSDVLGRFSKRSLATLLGISRQAIDHWGPWMPEHHATRLRERCPQWRRRKKPVTYNQHNPRPQQESRR